MTHATPVVLSLLMTACSGEAPTSPDSVFLDGEITAITLQQLEAAPSSLKNITLRSSGGDIDAAIGIGEIIRKRGLSVDVQDYCLSACASFLLPAASTVVIKPNSLVAMHHTAYALMETFEQSGFQTSAMPYAKIALKEKSYYESLGLKASSLAVPFSRIHPMCIFTSRDAGLDGISTRESYFIPSRRNMAVTFGVRVVGFWPDNPNQLADLLKGANPTLRRLSFVLERPNANMATRSTPLSKCA